MNKAVIKFYKVVQLHTPLTLSLMNILAAQRAEYKDKQFVNKNNDICINN